MRYPNFNTRLLYLLPRPGIGWVAHKLLRAQGIEINRSVAFGHSCVLVRSGVGVVVDSKTIVGDRVRIFHQVTIGRAHPTDARVGPEEHVVIGNDVVIGAGAKILCKPGETLRVAEGTVIGANAVLTKSTGARETWAGVPARRIS